MKILSVFLFQLFILSSFLFGQQIAQSDLPPGLLYEFQNRYPGVTNSEWKLQENKYTGTFMFMGNKVHAYYDITTKWLYSEIVMNMTDLPKNMQKFISTSFAQYKLNSIVFYESKTENYYKIESLLNEQLNYLYFDREGLFMKQTDKEGKIIINESAEMAKGKREVSFKELPTPANVYVDSNYPDLIVSKCYFINDDEFQNTYLVVLTKTFEKQSVQLYFDYKGELTKKTDPFENQKPESEVHPKGKKKQTQTTDIVVPETDVPEVARNDFKKRARNPQKAQWFKNDEGFYVSYIDPAKSQRNVIEYSSEGEWHKFSTELQFNELNPNIQKIVKESYPEFKIYSSANVTVPPKERYVLVRIYSPKWTNVPMVYHEMYFSTSGRLDKTVLAEYIETDSNPQKMKKNEKDENFDRMMTYEDNTISDDYQQISIKELPTKIVKHVSESQPGFVVQQCYIMTDDTTNEIQYWVVIKKEGYRLQKKLIYNFKGEFIAEEEM